MLKIANKQGASKQVGDTTDKTQPAGRGQKVGYPLSPPVPPVTSASLRQVVGLDAVGDQEAVEGADLAQAEPQAHEMRATCGGSSSREFWVAHSGLPTGSHCRVFIRIFGQTGKVTQHARSASLRHSHRRPCCRSRLSRPP